MKKINNTKKSKTLHFEGAGWAKAEHNDVGNCRIRATFENKQGTEIYLEFTAHSKGGLYKFPWNISHLFKTKDEKTNYTHEYSGFARERMEYTKENILNFVNEYLGCKFENIEVINDSSFSGFDVNGNRES